MTAKEDTVRGGEREDTTQTMIRTGDVSLHSPHLISKGLPRAPPGQKKDREELPSKKMSEQSELGAPQKRQLMVELKS